MKKLLLAGVATVVAAAPAWAADLPRKAPALQAAPAIAYDWNGFYIGGYYGGVVGNQKGSTDPNAIGGHTGLTNVNEFGFTAGGTVGYNWQIAPTWLIGFEGDFGYLGIDRTNTEFNDFVLVGLKTDWYGTARGRVGFVTGPSLIYATGGAAFVHMRDTFGGGLTAAGPTTFTHTHTGWTVGGGIETKLSRSWTAKTEYLYIDGGTTNFGSNPYGAVNVPTTFEHNFHVVKTGLNYKLGEPFWEGLPLFGTPSQLPSMHNWGGFYVGVNVGHGKSLVHTVNGTLGFNNGTTADINGNGFAGGGQVGYNFMDLFNLFGGRWFAGLEGDFGALRIRASYADWFDTSAQFTENTSWYATARGRFGTTTGPALLYATAGGAWVHFTDGFGFTGPGTGDLSSKTAGGWTIGGGTEVALDSRWSARLESLYIDVGHRNHSVFPGFALGADFKERFGVVRAGLNYKIGAD
jgi:outer membrane immunogenic protein